MTIGELKRLIANIPDDVKVLIPAPDETLNTPKFEHHTDVDVDFVVICLPATYYAR